MSNRLYLEPCEFTDVRSGEVSKGFRLFDDYAKTYCNTWESIPDNDLDVLALALENDDDEVVDLLDSVEKGMYIGDTWYDWSEIAHLFDPANAEE